MTKNKIIIASLTVGILILPVLAFAQLVPSVNVGQPTVGSLQQIIIDIENAAAAVFGAIAVICFLLAAVLFLTAGGAPEKVQAARSAFLWGIAGVVVGIIAFSIIAIVGSVIH